MTSQEVYRQHFVNVHCMFVLLFIFLEYTSIARDAVSPKSRRMCLRDMRRKITADKQSVVLAAISHFLFTRSAYCVAITRGITLGYATRTLLLAHLIGLGVGQGSLLGPLLVVV